MATPIDKGINIYDQLLFAHLKTDEINAKCYKYERRLK